MKYRIKEIYDGARVPRFYIQVSEDSLIWKPWGHNPCFYSIDSTKGYISGVINPPPPKITYHDYP
jgi:hypothetical protein